PEVLDTIDAINAARGTLQRRRVFKVSLDHFDALARQVPSRGTARVARQRAQCPPFSQHAANDRSTLPPRRARDEHGLVCIGHSLFSATASRVSEPSGTNDPSPAIEQFKDMGPG